MKYVLTAEGERYLTRVNAQMIPMHLVRVDVGSGISGQPEQLGEMLDVKQSLQIESVEQDVNEAVIHCMLTNLELHEGYLLQQAGVYAYDSLDDKNRLIFVGQDERGERIPPIEEREVQYLHNIAIRVSSTKEITFDISVSDFVRKEYLEQRLVQHGKVLVGPVDTETGPNDVLLILDEGFGAAAISNLTLSDAPPADGTGNWGVKIVAGKLTAAPEPDTDTTFFAQL